MEQFELEMALKKAKDVEPMYIDMCSVIARQLKVFFDALFQVIIMAI